LGPITLFDKSFLQSLNVDESIWFDHFFICNIAPLFYVETLADLQKAIGSGRTQEQEVGRIAEKTPVLHSMPNVFHFAICVANLLGYPVAMDGRVHVAGGRPVRTNKQSGIVIDETPEAKAFSRWQNGEFWEVERDFARIWRNMIALMNFDTILKKLVSLGINPANCRTLYDAKQIADSAVSESVKQFKLLELVFLLFNIPEQLSKKILQRWLLLGYPTLKSFAPYALYLLTVEIFFYVALATGLISRTKVTNKIDLAYLYYLPFCMIFTSSDRFHRHCAPLFLRDDQEFVWGIDLKQDLKKINAYYDKLPESEKEKGLYAIAPDPPRDEDFLICRLWDQFLPGWRSEKEPSIPMTKDVENHLIEHVKGFTKAKTISQNQVDFDLSNPDAMVIQRRVPMKRSKWWQLPKDLKIKNED